LSSVLRYTLLASDHLCAYVVVDDAHAALPSSAGPCCVLRWSQTSPRIVALPRLLGLYALPPAHGIGSAHA
jgi:hypothetical protein